MSKREVITWEHCRFINAEFSHYTFNGNGKNIAYFLAHDTALQKFEYTSCTPLANDIYKCKVLAFKRDTLQRLNPQRQNRLQCVGGFLLHKTQQSILQKTQHHVAKM